MPYDATEFDLPATTEPSLDGLIAWLETMPPEGEYYYSDCDECMAAQFYRHIGRKYRVVFCHNDNGDGPGESIAAKIEWVACEGTRTFGAALQRAKQVRAG